MFITSVYVPFLSKVYISYGKLEINYLALFLFTKLFFFKTSFVVFFALLFMSNSITLVFVVYCKHVYIVLWSWNMEQFSKEQRWAGWLWFRVSCTKSWL